jgi:hypothetical protein
MYKNDGYVETTFLTQFITPLVLATDNTTDNPCAEDSHVKRGHVYVFAFSTVKEIRNTFTNF